MIGLFLGSATGDAMGLPRENLSSKRAAKIFGSNIQPALVVIPWITRFSVCSDDTEHLWLTAQALIKSHDDSKIFEKELSSLLKRWVLTMPVGAGKASLKASFKLMLGAKNSGVYSAGNGPAMRAPIIGAFYANQPELREHYLNISTSLTHTHPEAYEGAWVIAEAMAMMVRDEPQKAPIEAFFASVLKSIKEPKLVEYLATAQQYLQDDRSLQDYLAAIHLKRGISGYITHTVPTVIYVWLYYFGDYKGGVEAIIKAGGDSDTTAAILGALLGINHENSIPKEWMNRIYNGPMSISKLRVLANASENRDEKMMPKFSWTLLLIRNLVLLVIVLLHGFRRLLPPY